MVVAPAVLRGGTASTRPRLLAAKLPFEPRNVIVEACDVSFEDVEHVSSQRFRQVIDRGDVFREPHALRPQHVESLEIELRLWRVVTGHMASVAHDEQERDEEVPESPHQGRFVLRTFHSRAGLFG